MTSGDIVPVGTCFFLGHDPEIGSVTSSKMYAVTARHVIDALRSLGRSDLTLRLNSKTDGDPPIAITTPLDDWFVHPTDKTVDVAIREMGIPANTDHLVIPFGMCATATTFAEHEVSLGDEVFISGLFRHHLGKRRNIPIVRTGNLAALNEEKVVTKACGEIDAILVEARSIGGLSGSPVFLNLGSIRQLSGQLKMAAGMMYFLLGLIHGHFDSPGGTVDVEDSEDAKSERSMQALLSWCPLRRFAKS